MGTGKYGEGWINPTRTRTPGQPATPVKIGSAFSRRNLHILCRYWPSSAKQKVAYQVGFCPFCGFFSVNICASENSCTRSSQNSRLWPVFTCEIPLGAYICRYSLFFFVLRTSVVTWDRKFIICVYPHLSAPIYWYQQSFVPGPSHTQHLVIIKPKSDIYEVRTTFSTGKKCRIMTKDLPKPFCGGITAFIVDLKFVTIECIVISTMSVRV